MPEDEQSTPGVIPVAAKEIIAQLRAMTRWLEGLMFPGFSGVGLLDESAI